jgi:hypothetical protein
MPTPLIRNQGVMNSYRVKHVPTWYVFAFPKALKLCNGSSDPKSDTIDIPLRFSNEHVTVDVHIIPRSLVQFQVDSRTDRSHHHVKLSPRETIFSLERDLHPQGIRDYSAIRSCSRVATTGEMQVELT